MDTRRLPKDYNEKILYFLPLKFLLIWIKLDRHFNFSRCWQNCSASYVFLLLFVFHSYFFGKQAEVKTTPFSHLNPLNLIYFFFLINVFGGQEHLSEWLSHRLKIQNLDSYLKIQTVLQFVRIWGKQSFILILHFRSKLKLIAHKIEIFQDFNHNSF